MRKLLQGEKDLSLRSSHQCKWTAWSLLFFTIFQFFAPPEKKEVRKRNSHPSSQKKGVIDFQSFCFFSLPKGPWNWRKNTHALSLRMHIGHPHRLCEYEECTISIKELMGVISIPPVGLAYHEWLIWRRRKKSASRNLQKCTLFIAATVVVAYSRIICPFVAHL